ncbi:MAG TPA: hypothetical protein VFD36_03770, partial [Kofleriaceae bacterium]|nr:hypothetical protein [Kofleriaceae bacterium]
MRLPSERWLKVVFVVTAVVFASVTLYIYALRFFAWAESDAAVTVVLAGKILDAGSPVVDNWYYANGDVWCFGPHLLALLPVAVLGIGPASLLIAVVVGFALELSVLVYEYARLCSERWIALFAAMVTLTVWSQSHAAFVYAQLAYGYSAVVYLFLFAQVARLAEHGAPRAWRWLAVGAILAVLTVQNPTRAVVFGLAPLLAACAWPWHGLTLRRRLGIGAALVAGWAVAYAVYALVFTRVVQFSVPRGFTEFAFANRVGIAANLGNLARGLLLLCGDGTFPGALPGLIVLIGAIGLVVAHQLESRALTRSRFLCTVVSAQFIMVCVPLVIGNLLVSRDSVRYLIPSLITMFGLAAILAVRAVATAGARSRRWLAAGWLGAVPVAALFAMPGARPPQPAHYV